MRILITGAAGRIGHAVAAHLQEQNHDVVATDAIYRPDLPFKLHLADLRDRNVVYPLIEGCDAVLHLGNHPNAISARPAQKLMAENVAMNANVFYAALEVGIRRIITISSVQATTLRHNPTARGDEWVRTCHWPYLPADGKLPQQPGNNQYALSKVFAEQTLEAMTQEHADLAAAVVRLPWVNTKNLQPRWAIDRPLKPQDHRLAEGLTYLSNEDACTSLQAIVEQLQPGYGQYFVAQSLAVRGFTNDELAQRFFPNQKIVGPLNGPGGLIDLSPLKAEYGWSPAAPPIEIDLSDGDA